MKNSEKTTFKQSIIVTAEDTALRYGSGRLDVYATPAMIAFMENTAHKNAESFLSEKETTVGIEVCVKHIKATPPGMMITCESIVTKIEGKKVFFDVKAWDQKGLIGEGTHIRFIVDADRFMEKLKQ